MKLFDPTGLIESRPNCTVLAEDSFHGDMAGWTQLFTPDSDGTTAPDNGQRYVCPLTRIARSGSHRIALRTPSISDTAARPIQAMGIKRMANVTGDGEYLMEMLVSIESATSDLTRPIEYGWGLDTALDDGMRRFYRVRFWNWSESAGAVQSKWQLKMGAGSTDANFTDIPGATVNLTNLTNENKALPFYLALHVNTQTGRFKGFRFGNLIRAGSLAATPDTSLESLGAVASEALTTFVGGFNSCFDIINRTNASRTRSQSNVHWHRLTHLGA